MKKFIGRFSAAAAAASLLCGYTVLNTGLIDWQYWGTPTAGNTYPYNPPTGAPTSTQYSRTLPNDGVMRMPTDLLSRVRVMLPESKSATALVPATDDAANLQFNKNVNVAVTFVHEGATYLNSVGYFIYDPANPPKTPAEVQEKIIFANASMATPPTTSAPLDPADASYQNTFQIEDIPAGKALGFVIVSNGYSTVGRTLSNGTKIGGVRSAAAKNSVFYSLRHLNPESTDSLRAHSILLQDVSLTDASKDYQRLVLGFEDKLRESGSDDDFNDVVLAIHVTPRSGIANLGSLPGLPGQTTDTDTDKDGVPDTLDEFPKDPKRAFSRYYPGSNTWGTLAFEDRWPWHGDYDMNDLVVRYRSREVLSPARQVVALELDYRLDARGATSDSGFGVNLPNVAAGAVSAARLYTDDVLATAQVEAGQSEATFIVAPSAKRLMPAPSDCFVNTQLSCTSDDKYVKPVSMRLEVDFSTPQAAQFAPPYNPFIYSGSKRGQEVHLPGKKPTALADATLFGTQDDRTNVAAGYTYMDAKRRPWALDIPAAWNYPLEGVDMLKAFPSFADWATSAGVNSRDWYTGGVTGQVYKR